MNLRDHTLKVEYRGLDRLKPSQCNPRTHSGKQIEKIANSITTFGFTNPVLIDDNYHIVAGHGRLAAAKRLGLLEVPTVCLSHMTPAQRRAYVIADNRLAELAGWDEETLAIELQGLLEMDIDFDLEVVGFEAPDVDLLIQGLASDNEPEEEIPVVEEADVVSRPGDLWVLGEHRVLCANVLHPDAVETLMDGERARMVISDPPFNVAIEGHANGLGRVRHPNFAMACGEMSSAEYTKFLSTALGNMAAHCVDGSLHYVFIDWRHLEELIAAGRTVYTELKNLCVWNKDNGGMGSLYRSKHELVLVFKHGRASHVNNIELGRHGRNRTNVWDYPAPNCLHPNRPNDLHLHPTVKPVALVADALLDASQRGDLVLDGFGGAGTTVLAAERTGRRARVMEIEPRYVDITVRRWQQATGCSAAHAQTDGTFGERTDT